jgi:vitamin B12 transporter
MAALSIVTLAHAQGTIVITGVREPLASERLAADVVVIDAEAIARSGADSLADLLRREAGLQLSRNGGPGQSAGLFVRGGAAQQTVVLVDGVRIGSATLGFAGLESLPLAQVERVEVLRGPGSSIHGADAMGGVVQVFTRRGDALPRVEARAATGGRGGREASVGAAGGGAAWDAAASVAHERSRGVSALRPGDLFGNFNPDADGYTLTTAQAQLGVRPAEGHRVGLVLLRSRLNAQYDASEFLPPTFAQDASPDFRNRTVTEVGAFDWRAVLAAGCTASARVSRSDDDSRTGGTLIERFRTRREAAQAQLAWETGVAGQLVVALEHLRETGASTSYAADAKRRGDAAAASLTGSAGPWSWQADLRRDRSSDFGGVTTARLGGAYSVRPGLRLRALAGTTFRAPSFNDLYFPGYGVPSLEPERGRSVEAGVQWKDGATTFDATLWRNRVRDLVAYEPDRGFCPADPAYDFGCARNVARARLQGATLAARARAGDIGLKAQLDFLDATDATTGARLTRRAAFQGSAGADWAVGAWSLAADLLHVGARPDLGKRLRPETTLDLVARWRFAPGFELFAKLLNAADARVEPARDYQGPGRQAWLGLKAEGTW